MVDYRTQGRAEAQAVHSLDRLVVLPCVDSTLHSHYFDGLRSARGVELLRIALPSTLLFRAQSDNPDAIGRVLWQLTDREYEQASAAFLKVKTNTAVQSEEEDKSPDFSEESASNHLSYAQAKVSMDQKAWENRIRTVSGAFLIPGLRIQARMLPAPPR